MTAALDAIYALSDGNKENRVLFGVEGACEAIIGAMKAHINTGSVIRAGSGAIVHMVQADDTNLHQVRPPLACLLIRYMYTIHIVIWLPWLHFEIVDIVWGV